MAVTGSAAAVSAPADADSGRGALLAIAGGTGMASLAMNFWIPFLPLYMRELGATSDANALFWAGVATSIIGVARLISGPLWGVLSDRFGRKLMFVRALAFATGTTLIAAFATEPWHVVVAFSCQGLFSGFIPAAIALTSVSVPESRLGPSLGYVSAAQYLGTTIGPALGGIVAVFAGLRGAIVAAAILPAVAALAVWLLVPRDTLEATPAKTAAGDFTGKDEPSALRQMLTGQFMLVVALYFFVFAATQLVRIASPIAIDRFVGKDSAKAMVSVAFTVGGLASVAGLLLVSRRTAKPGHFRMLLGVSCLAAGVGQLALGLASNVALYIAAFAFASFMTAIMIPATNTLIASNVRRGRRGTAFGVASSAQALAFIVGPSAATIFAATSLKIGLAGSGVLFGLVAVGVLVFLREPATARPD